MGCNCKNKAKRVSTTKVQEEIKNIKETSLEKLNKMLLEIDEINTNQEIRKEVEPLLVEILGFVLPPYCDQICQKSLKKRIENIISSI